MRLDLGEQGSFHAGTDVLRDEMAITGELPGLPRGVYPITDLPAEMKQSDIVRITLLSFGVSVIATLYPALRASKTRPAEALSYE